MSQDGRKPVVEEVTLHGDLTPETKQKAIDREFDYARLGLIAGVFVIVVGAGLAVAGGTGVVEWNLSLFSLSSKLSNATPGVVLGVIGFAIIVATRPKVKSSGRG